MPIRALSMLPLAARTAVSRSAFSAPRAFPAVGGVSGPAVRALSTAAPAGNSKVFFDVDIGGKAAGRIVFELFNGESLQTL
jgi:hypothetical protein